jgi:hypothetical protein
MVILTLLVTLPFSPVQVMVYVCGAVRAAVIKVPDVCDEKLEEQLVAFVELQVRVVGYPEGTGLGEAERVSVGGFEAGGGVCGGWFGGSGVSAGYTLTRTSAVVSWPSAATQVML